MKKTFSQKHLVILLLLLNTFQRFQCHRPQFDLKNSPSTLPPFDEYTSIMQSCGPKTPHLTKVYFNIKSLSGSHSLTNSASIYRSAIQCHCHGAGAGADPLFFLWGSFQTWPSPPSSHFSAPTNPMSTTQRTPAFHRIKNRPSLSTL